MESRSPALRQQNRSFNPEAASFNPTPSVASLSTLRVSELRHATPDRSSVAAPTAGASVQRGFAPLFALANSESLGISMFKHSPFRTLGDVRSFPRVEQSLAIAPFRVGDVFSLHAYPPAERVEDVPSTNSGSMPALARLERRDIPTPRVVGTPLAAPSANDKTQSSSCLAEHSASPWQHNSSTDPVCIDELSAGLGLPGLEHPAKTDSRPSVLRRPPGLEYPTNTEYPPLSPNSKPADVVCNSRQPWSPPHGTNQSTMDLYGKLIDQALNKPLTAKGLAEYLQGQAKLMDAAKAVPDTTDTVVVGRTRQRSGTAGTMRPPHASDPAEKLLEAPSEYVPGVSATLLHKAIPSSHHPRQRKSSDHSPGSYQHHMRRTSNIKRHRPRQNSRIKRMDQGPMPSSADIYPDDAAWSPADYTSNNRPTYTDPPPYAPQVLVSEPTSWPTPAEVYTHRAASPPPAAPTPADITAVYPDVLCLLAELPFPSAATLGTLLDGDGDVVMGRGLSCETRPLTPGQSDGSRYGIRCQGLGEGEGWKFPVMEEGMQFRVRPRNHDGWGGWEWAVEKGWGG